MAYRLFSSSLQKNEFTSSSSTPPSRIWMMGYRPTAPSGRGTLWPMMFAGTAR